MISIIIPCYNCESFVRRAIESVLLQTYHDWELLLVNNNSSDGTQIILEEYQKRFPHKINTYHEEKSGAQAARNNGLYNAKGEWIQFLDADDELMPNKLKRQLNILSKNDADIIAGCFIWVKKEKGKFIRIKLVPDGTDIWLSLASSSMGRTSANLWRKAPLLDIKGWDEKLSSSQEYDLLFRLLKNTAKIYFDTEPSAIIYNMGNSISKSVDKKRNAQIIKNWLDLRLEIKGYLKETGQLNGHLNRRIDCLIFNYLMDKKKFSPNYVNNQLENLAFDLPLSLKLKRNYKYLVMKFIRRLGL